MKLKLIDRLYLAWRVLRGECIAARMDYTGESSSRVTLTFADHRVTWERRRRRPTRAERLEARS